MSVRRAQDERLEGTPDGNTAITGIMDVPDAPTIGTATDGGTGTTASVTFTAATTGGTATSFTATSSPGSISGSSASSPITVSGLTTGTSYTFTVTATNSTGTSAASAASNSVTPEIPTAYENIATVTVGSGGSSTITFSSITGTYAHLQLRSIAQDSGSSPGYNASLRFNSDTANNYSRHWLSGDGSTTSGFSGYNTSYIEWGYLNGNTTSTSYSGVIIDIFDYANTNKHKTVRMLQGYDANGSGYVALRSGLWRSTSAITTITLETYGTGIRQYSHFALYGIKGS